MRRIGWRNRPLLTLATRVTFATVALVAGSLLSASHVEAASPAETVAAHLAAGEYALAAEAATTAPNAAEKAHLLTQVAAAQGNTSTAPAARGTLSRIDDQDARSRAIGAQTQRQALAGGGAQADFGPLMFLIQQHTSGQWEERDGAGGTMAPFQTGVRVAPGKMLSKLSTTDTTGRLTSLGEQVRQAELNDDMAQVSGLRLVSLKRLEQAVAERIRQGLPVAESMARVGGLSKVEYIFVDRANKDILIGGPAEGWEYRQAGEPVGTKSGRPMLQLDDFVTVLRTFATGERDFGCSINTRDEGVKALQDYAAASQARGPLDSRSVRPWVQQLQRKLGKQDVVVWGVPNDSRVARVVVEADYRMKLIGIDRLDAGKEIPSYFDLLGTAAPKNPPAMEALRWWLTMKYEAVAHSPDKSVFEIQGSAVLCQSENQMLTAEGKHLPTGQSEPINRQFAELFTNNYGQLAARDQVFADMQNIFDLALVSALIRKEKLAENCDWDLGAFAPEGAYRPARHVVPRELDSVVNHRVYRGKDIVVQVAGGVRADLLAVAQDQALARESTSLTAVETKAAAPTLPAGRWWWDAAK